MEDKATLEYFLSLLDECERVIKNDNLSEKHIVADYELKEKTIIPSHATLKANEILYQDQKNSCKECEAWKNRIKAALPILNKGCKVMFILPAPEGMTLLTEDSGSYFKKWYTAIGLGDSDITLTSLIRCPMSTFKKEYADKCKNTLREEMIDVKPKLLCLLGYDVAKYMLRKDIPFDEIRGKRYVINNIPAYVTYCPRDLVNDRNLRGPIWEDLKLLKEAF